MAKSIEILQGRARLYPPKNDDLYWRISYYDRITGERKTTRGGGKTRDSAELKAAELVGDWTPNTRGEAPPTLQEVFDAWMDKNTHRWSTRTFDQYTYQAHHFLARYGEVAISQLSPRDFSKVDVSHLSRGQQTKVRSLIRGTMNEAARWVQGEPDDYANAIRLSGSREESRDDTVQRGDVAPASFIHDVINACYATCQVHPVITNTMHEDGVQWVGGANYNYEHWSGYQGMDLTWVQQTHRRGMPKHYKNIEKRLHDENIELAARYRMFALAVAMAAGVGLRIGEILPLRVRDFVANKRELMESLFVNARATPEQQNSQLAAWGYRGALEINKQSSRSGSGRIVLSRPKYDQIRTVYLPGVLYNPIERTPFLRQARRDQLIQTGLENFQNPHKSLWDMDWDEALHVWKQDEDGIGGMVPLHWLLLNRLNDLWDTLHQRSQPGHYRFDDFQKLLLFPTRSQPRKNSSIEVPRNWHEDVSLVPDFGGYASTTNFANVMTNPIFDYVSAKTRSYPQHRQNLVSEKRKGWTFHGLRHFFITSNIYHGVPLPEISEMAGHASINFTLTRYSHALRKDYKHIGFE